MKKLLPHRSTSDNCAIYRIERREIVVCRPSGFQVDKRQLRDIGSIYRIERRENVVDKRQLRDIGSMYRIERREKVVRRENVV
ncbi:hypothetical protein DPMN_131954 [Dreissena polymorpha]|uniref:Uncharacterized protein n=1 Tax=Dreissena polymorpha TaxID=45954 RepID=A0A9D4JCQ0_DREPO|nr:hypothetical protein DPMN_131954 [Dreissena polymorpha]